MAVPASVEGHSFAGILRNPAAHWARKLLLENYTRTPVVGRAPSYCGVRTDSFLFVQYANGAQELYDERRDPYELRNVAGSAENAAAEDQLRRETRRLCTPPPPGFTF